MKLNVEFNHNHSIPNLCNYSISRKAANQLANYLNVLIACNPKITLSLSNDIYVYYVFYTMPPIFGSTNLDEISYNFSNLPSSKDENKVNYEINLKHFNDLLEEVKKIKKNYDHQTHHS